MSKFGKLDFHAEQGCYFVVRNDEWVLPFKTYCPDMAWEEMNKNPDSYIEVRDGESEKIIEVIYPADEHSQEKVSKVIDEHYIVREKANEYGGSFERALAQAIRYADTDNLMRIRKAFPEFWNKWLKW